MADFVETYIERIRKKNILKKIVSFFQNMLNSSEKYTQKGKIHIEIEKTKLERKKKYIKLGKFISDSYKDEKVILEDDSKIAEINYVVEEPDKKRTHWGKGSL